MWACFLSVFSGIPRKRYTYFNGLHQWYSELNLLIFSGGWWWRMLRSETSRFVSLVSVQTFIWLLTECDVNRDEWKITRQNVNEWLCSQCICGKVRLLLQLSRSSLVVNTRIKFLFSDFVLESRMNHLLQSHFLRWLNVFITIVLLTHFSSVQWLKHFGWKYVKYKMFSTCVVVRQTPKCRLFLHVFNHARFCLCLFCNQVKDVYIVQVLMSSWKIFNFGPELIFLYRNERKLLCFHK